VLCLHVWRRLLNNTFHACCAAHGEDKFILTDFTLLPTVLRIAPQLPQLRAVIVLTDRCVCVCFCVCVCVCVCVRACAFVC
jgi:hypothetical protein